MDYLELFPGDRVIVKGRHSKINAHWMNGNYTGSMQYSVGKEFSVIRKANALARCEGIEKVPCYIINGSGLYYAISDLFILPNKRNINHPYFWARRLNKLPSNMA